MKIYRKVAEEFQARAKEMRVTNFQINYAYMKIYRKVAEEFQARAKEMRVTNFHKYEASLSIQN